MAGARERWPAAGLSSAYRRRLGGKRNAHANAGSERSRSLSPSGWPPSRRRYAGGARLRGGRTDRRTAGGARGGGGGRGACGGEGEGVIGERRAAWKAAVQAADAALHIDFVGERGSYDRRDN